MSRAPAVPAALPPMLADLAAVPRVTDPAAHYEAMLHAYTLKKLSSLLAPAGLDVLLVKGAALALTVYPEPAARRMTDIDVLVREGESDRVVAALAAGGCDVRPEPGRRYSAPLQGEVGVFVHAGAMTELVEVHTALSKVTTHPIAMRDVFARATPAPSLPGLLVPSAEDHALFVALHAASHDFGHAVAYLDLELLLRRGLDVDVLVRRARAWRLTSVMFAMLGGMRALGSASVTGDLVARFDPGPLRRALVRDAASRGPSRPGLGWIVAQTPLRDDPLAWTLGVARYAAARVRDREWLGSGAAPRQDGPVPYRTPLWVRALMTVDRAASSAGNVLASVRDEALLAWIPPGERSDLTSSVYADLETYLPGGSRFRSGLFSWEERALSGPHFPRSGRVLLGGAGAGRELVALVERGFDVVAFDPCAPFADAARSAVPAAKAQVLHASYDDLVAATAGRGGPLARACAGPPFDAVILGWGSLSHVLPSSARATLLRALRVVCPSGPVLASFGLVTEPRITPGKGRVRNALRSAFAALGAPGLSEDRDHFLLSTGFFAFLTRDELVKLAWDAGYEIAFLEEFPYPHAIFLPLAQVK